jgi:hypothetical protein
MRAQGCAEYTHAQDRFLDHGDNHCGAPNRSMKGWVLRFRLMVKRGPW